MYGNRFTREYGDSAPDTWHRTITSLKDYELTRGLRRLLQQGSGSPPTLPQFVKACKAADPDDVVRPQNTLVLPPPGIDRYTAFGNRTLLAYLMDPKRVNPSEASLQRMVAAKNNIIENCRQIEDEPLTSAEIQAALTKRFTELYEPMPAAELEAARHRAMRSKTDRSDHTAAADAA